MPTSVSPVSTELVTRELSHGGMNATSANSATAAAAMPARRPASARPPTGASAIPTRANSGSPTAGNVQTQSPAAWTAK